MKLRDLKRAVDAFQLEVLGDYERQLSDKDVLQGLAAALVTVGVISGPEAAYARDVYARGDLLQQARRRRETRERHSAWLLTATPEEIRLRESLANCADQTRDLLEWNYLNQSFKSPLI
jgi:hypothetical protein